MLDMHKGRGVIVGIVLAGVSIAGLLIATRGGASGDDRAAPAPGAGDAPPAERPAPPTGAASTRPGLPPVDSRFPPAVAPPPPLSPDEMQGYTGGATAYPGRTLDGHPTPVDDDPAGAGGDAESTEGPREEGGADAAVVEVPRTVDARALARLYERLGITELRRVGTQSRVLLPAGVDAARVERELAELAASR